MSEPFLIAHLVRGEPAFDIATKIVCPECRNVSYDNEDDYCAECDATGFWWIIPTSGHRAYPFYTIPLKQCVDMHYMDGDVSRPMIAPTGWPDHYPHSASPRTTPDLRSLGLARPQLKIQRRI